MAAFCVRVAAAEGVDVAAQESLVDADPALLDEPVLYEATTCAVMDKTGEVLYEREGWREMPPASITKVMTAMVVLDSGRSLDEEVTLVAPDLGPDSQMAGFADGDVVRLDELLRVMLVFSANDAAYNVAVFAAGSEQAFVDRMNAKAVEIGMEHTHFVNPHGLEADGHYTCAIDLCRLGRYALEHYPFIAQTALLGSVDTTVGGYSITLTATNRLLDMFYGIRGLKTGAIAGHYTFLGSSGRGDVQLYASVLGCSTFMGRFLDTATLMEWAYAHMGTRELAGSDWLVDVRLDAFDLAYKDVVTTGAGATAPTWNEDTPLVFERTMSRANRLLEAGSDVGWASWRREDTVVGGAVYETQSTPQRLSAWPLFETPLFANV